MSTLLDTALMQVGMYDVNNPFTFVLAGIGLLILMRKWGIVFLTLLTVALGRVTSDLIVFNLTTDHPLVEVPTVVYVGGAAIIALVLMVTYTKYTIE